MFYFIFIDSNYLCINMLINQNQVNDRTYNQIPIKSYIFFAFKNAFLRNENKKKLNK